MPAPCAGAMPPPEIAVIAISGKEIAVKLLLATAFSADVHDHGVSHENSLQTGSLDASAQVNILSVHQISGIKTAQLGG